jgi:hypothetical protein
VLKKKKGETGVTIKEWIELKEKSSFERWISFHKISGGG